MEMSRIKPIALVTGLIAVVVMVFAYLRSNTKLITNMAQYSLVGLKVGKPKNIFQLPIKASILIKNPSDLAIDIRQYIVEVYRTKGTVKTKLAVSNATALKIPARNNIINDIDFTINNLDILNLLKEALTSTGTVSAEAKLKGQLSFVVKAEVMGQYIEKEIVY